jgi:hypothetical protein
MPYRKIRVEAKVEAVTRVFRGERVTAVADAMGISRNSLAMWVWRAHTSMRSSIERKNAGRDGRVVNGAAQLKKLREKIARREKTIQTMRGYLRVFQEGPVPARCAKCGCARFYRNGLYMMRMEHLLGVRINGANGKIPVQKFTCVSCGSGARLEGPAALYHWVTGSHRSESGKNGHAVENNLCNGSVMRGVVTPANAGVQL